jgi:hypothetical protein
VCTKKSAALFTEPMGWLEEQFLGGRPSEEMRGKFSCILFRVVGGVNSTM